MNGEILSVLYRDTCVPKKSYVNDSTPMSVCIYMISCKDESVSDKYIGQTRDFEVRRTYHMKDCSSDKQQYVHRFIHTHGGWDNWNIIIIEEYICNFIESLIIEWYWWNKVGASLNKAIPGIKYVRHIHISRILEIEVNCRLT